MTPSHLKDYDSGERIIATEDEDWPRILTKEKTLEQLIKEGITPYDKKKEAVDMSARLPGWMDRNLTKLSRETGESELKIIQASMKRGTVDIQEMAKDRQIGQTKQFISNIAECMHGPTDRTVVLDLIGLKWRCLTQGQQQPTRIRAPGWVAGKMSNLERDLDINQSDCVKLILSAGFIASENILRLTGQQATELINSFEVVLMKQAFIFSGFKIWLPQFIKNSFDHPEISNEPQKESAEAIHNIFMKTCRHQSYIIRNLFTLESLEEIDDILTEFGCSSEIAKKYVYILKDI